MIGRAPARLLVATACALAFGLSPMTADERPERGPLDPSLPYQARRARPVTYDVDYSVVVTAPYHTKSLKVWLPLPQSDAGQEVEEGRLTTFPMKVEPRVGQEKRFGNRFAYFEFDHPEGAQIIRHQFRIKVWELNWDVDPGRVERVEEWPAAFGPYVKGDRAVAVDDRITTALRDIVKERRGAAHDLGAVMAWLQANMKYDHSNASLSADARKALEAKTGHCSDYHGLCASFGRALGVPTRVTYGINTFPKNSPSHCKMEAYLPPHGWVSFDVSETQRMVEAIRKDPARTAGERDGLVEAARARLRRGFRDNTWFVQTRGTDYELVPPASEKVKVVRTIYAEADGRPLPDPDPADPKKKEFAWMTAHEFKADRPVSYPFKDVKTLFP